MKHSSRILMIILCLTAAIRCWGIPAVISFDGSHGLSNGYIVSMSQDGDGYVWVATEYGLFRFDGTRFRSFSHNNSGLTANEFNCVAFIPTCPDSLYIATQRDGICVYDRTDGTIRPLHNSKFRSPDVTSIVPASDGGIWLTHYHFGAQHYDPETGMVRNYDASTIDGLPNGAWTVAEGNDHTIYIGHTYTGMSVVNTRDNTSVNFDKSSGLPGNTVYAICVDRSGNVWLGTEEGAALFNPATSAIVPFVHEAGRTGTIAPGRIRSIIQQDNGEIWFATSQGGISVLDTRAYTYADIRDAVFATPAVDDMNGILAGKNVRSLFRDSFGNTWVGNYRSGIEVIGHLDPVFSRLEYLTDKACRHVYNPVYCFAEGSRGATCWLGGDNEIVRVDGNVCTPVPLPVTALKGNPIVRTLCAASDGSIWIGTTECGAIRYLPSGKFSRVATGGSYDVRTFLETPDGAMLIGTDQGVYMSDGTRAWLDDTITGSLRDWVIQDMEYDSSGNLWVGTFGKGVTVFDRSMKVAASHDIKNGFPSNAINAIRRDSKGRMWIATRKGVALFDRPGNNSFYRTFPELADGDVTHVKSIEEGADGSIWLATNKGLIHMTPDNLKVSFIGFPDVISSPSFIEGASMRDDSGNIYFGSGDGALRINPKALADMPAPSPVKITDFIVYNHSDEDGDTERRLHITGNEIELGYDDNTFALTFNIIDPEMAGRTDIAYTLEGNGHDSWIESGDDNTAIFRNLPPGEYYFRVKERLKGYEWSRPATILKIRIIPPLWLTWWAKTIYSLLIAALLTLLALYYRRRISLKQQLIAEREKSRDRQMLNEERLRFYTNITHELRTPLTLIMGPLEDIVSDPSLPGKYSYKLQTIRDSSATLLNLINSILEFRKTETQNRQLMVKRADPANLLREIGLRYKELNRNPDVRFILDIETGGPEIYFDTDMITTILNNLLSNAVKYTRSGSITLSYHTVTGPDGMRRSVIEVADTGYGISAKGVEHIFERYFQEQGEHQASGTGIGLALVKNLADIHRADISVKSQPGKGSTFTLQLLTDETYPEAMHAPDEPTTRKPDPAKEEEPQPDMPGDTHSRLRLLVVEDNDDIREYIRQALAGEFDVAVAHNGLEGLKMCQELSPHLVISDIMMPEMDGIAMCRSIKEDILTSHIPVILLTAKDSLVDREEGYDAGADSYLTKPFSAKLLLSRIYSIFRIRRRIAEKFMSTDSLSPATEGQQELQETFAAESHEIEKALSPLDRRFMEKITSVINDNIALEDLSVAFIADKMCMSISTLYRKINAIVGVSTNEYIRHMRLSRAVELLRTGEMSITDIAENTGFGSHSSFAKAFKKKYGMTATEYVSKHFTEK